MVTGARTALTVDLSGLRVAITAGANGIGKVLADGFAACGASVFVSDIDAAALAGCGHPGVVADAGDVAALERFMDAALAHHGGLDVLVNNAGIAGPTKRVEDVTPEELDATPRIDLAAMFHCARRAVPALRASGGGSIINLSSAAGRFGFPMRSPYAAAKWGVVGLTKTLAIELGPDGIIRDVGSEARIEFGAPTRVAYAPRRASLWIADSSLDRLVALRIRTDTVARAPVRRVAYVSCDPASFARDVKVLVEHGFTLTRITPVDQFRWSPHVEVVGAMER